jgi:two-component sensor histidine kinase
VVTISDDGPGMDVANDRAQYGVSLVRQLAGQLQGRADVTSSGGTRWEIAVPLHAAAEMAS